MNLRSFHVVFIAASTALALWFGVWALNSSGLEGGPRILAGLAGFGLAAGLVAYEAWFLRYSKRAR